MTDLLPAYVADAAAAAARHASDKWQAVTISKAFPGVEIQVHGFDNAATLARTLGLTMTTRTVRDGVTVETGWHHPGNPLRVVTVDTGEGDDVEDTADRVKPWVAAIPAAPISHTDPVAGADTRARHRAATTTEDQP